jgi:hypothetical protein
VGPIAALLAAVAIAAAPARAATTIVADPAAQEVTALDGTLVWVSGAPGAQTLMQHDASGARPVQVAPPARLYRSIDLGRDRAGGPVLTYLRCRTIDTCVARRDDLRGHRGSFKGLGLPRCTLTTAPAVWRTAVAYGLACHKRGSRTLDAARSGRYLEADRGSPRRLAVPRAVTRAGATIGAVDLRGGRVAAVAEDVAAYAFSQTTAGTGMRSFTAAVSEGDTDERVAGMALGTTRTLWTLTTTTYPGEPNSARIARLEGACHTQQTLTNPPGPAEAEGYPATALTADGPTLYLAVPGAGVVAHHYTPDRPDCA